MKRWTGLALMVVVAVLFLIVNRGAYQGYFQADELDNISWAPAVRLAEYATYLATPRFIPENFRPVGHFFFAVTGRVFGLDFPSYVFPIHALHLLNVWLLWLIARRLGCNVFAACAGAAFYVFHMACFDVYWKPMYVFDLLCGTFVLATLYLWLRDLPVWAFVTFWLAYKSKELAVMLPFVLLAYEYWLGKRRWKPLLPFLAAAISFGIQGVLLNPARGSGEYAFRFSGIGLYDTVRFYSARLFLIPGGGYVLPFLPFLVRDRRVWFGILAVFLFFVPLAFLPGRTFAAYCYVPLTGLALAIAAIADHGHRLFVVIFFLFWIPFNLIHLRMSRRQALAIAEEHRRYVSALRDFVPTAPETRRFIFDGRPFALYSWGIEGALNYLYQRRDVAVYAVEDKAAQALLRSEEPVAVLSWDPGPSRLVIASRRKDAPDASFIRMGRDTPIWQLDEGWYANEGGFRWTRPGANAHLYRPEGARRLELTVHISPDMIHDVGRVSVRVWVEHHRAGDAVFTQPGWQTVRWDLPPAPAGRVRVRIQSEPYHPSNKDPRPLGVPVVSFGFPE